MKPNTLFVTLSLATNDPAQIVFAEELKKFVQDLPGRTANDDADRPAEGKYESLMGAGRGALSLAHVSSEIYMHSYLFTYAYRDGDKVTFVATLGENANSGTDSALDAIFASLTGHTGWQVARYANPNGTIAFAAKNPVDLAKKAAKAATRNAKCPIYYIRVFPETK